MTASPEDAAVHRGKSGNSESVQVSSGTPSQTTPSDSSNAGLKPRAHAQQILRARYKEKWLPAHTWRQQEARKQQAQTLTSDPHPHPLVNSPKTAPPSLRTTNSLSSANSSTKHAPNTAPNTATASESSRSPPRPRQTVGLPTKTQPKFDLALVGQAAQRKAQAIVDQQDRDISELRSKALRQIQRDLQLPKNQPKSQPTVKPPRPPPRPPPNQGSEGFQSPQYEEEVIAPDEIVPSPPVQPVSKVKTGSTSPFGRVPFPSVDSRRSMSSSPATRTPSLPPRPSSRRNSSAISRAAAVKANESSSSPRSSPRGSISSHRGSISSRRSSISSPMALEELYGANNNTNSVGVGVGAAGAGSAGGIGAAESAAQSASANANANQALRDPPRARSVSETSNVSINSATAAQSRARSRALKEAEAEAAQESPVAPRRPMARSARARHQAASTTTTNSGSAVMFGGVPARQNDTASAAARASSSSSSVVQPRAPMSSRFVKSLSLALRREQDLSTEQREAQEARQRESKKLADQQGPRLSSLALANVTNQLGHAPGSPQVKACPSQHKRHNSESILGKSAFNGSQQGASSAFTAVPNAQTAADAEKQLLQQRIDEDKRANAQKAAEIAGSRYEEHHAYHAMLMELPRRNRRKHMVKYRPAASWSAPARAIRPQLKRIATDAASLYSEAGGSASASASANANASANASASASTANTSSSPANASSSPANASSSPANATPVDSSSPWSRLTARVPGRMALSLRQKPRKPRNPVRTEADTDSLSLKSSTSSPASSVAAVPSENTSNYPESKQKTNNALGFGAGSLYGGLAAPAELHTGSGLGLNSSAASLPRSMHSPQSSGSQQPPHMLSSLRTKFDNPHRRRFDEDRPWRGHRELMSVSEREKKRYESLWAANKDRHLPYLYVPGKYQDMWLETVAKMVPSLRDIVNGERELGETGSIRNSLRPPSVKSVRSFHSVRSVGSQTLQTPNVQTPQTPPAPAPLPVPTPLPVPLPVVNSRSNPGSSGLSTQSNSPSSGPAIYVPFGPSQPPPSMLSQSLLLQSQARADREMLQRRNGSVGSLLEDMHSKPAQQSPRPSIHHVFSQNSLRSVKSGGSTPVSGMSPALGSGFVPVYPEKDGIEPSDELEEEELEVQSEADMEKEVEKRMNDIHGYVVSRIWRRSQLPDETLEHIWDLVDTNQDGTLDSSSFVVGMWLCDQCLYGRKLPPKVPIEVWQSVAPLNLKIRVKERRSKIGHVKRLPNYFHNAVGFTMHSGRNAVKRAVQTATK